MMLTDLKLLQKLEYLELSFTDQSCYQLPYRYILPFSVKVPDRLPEMIGIDISEPETITFVFADGYTATYSPATLHKLAKAYGKPICDFSPDSS